MPSRFLPSSSNRRLIRWTLLALVTAVPSYHFVTESMRASNVRAANAALSFPGHRAVVVGGTSGIGKAIALRLAAANFDVTIVGRNREAGAEIVAALEAAGSPHPSFISADVSLLQSGSAVVDAWTRGARSAAPATAETPSLSVLVLSQGIASLRRDLTSEGIDNKLSLHHYSRVGLIQRFLPALRTPPAASDAAVAAAAGGGGGGSGGGGGGGGTHVGSAVVLSVLSGGVHSVYPLWREDPGVSEKSYSIVNAANAAGLYQDCALDALASDPANVGITFAHAAPGIVQSAWGSGFPWPLRWLVRAAQVFARSGSDCAEYMLDPVFKDLQKARGGGFRAIDQYGGDVKRAPIHLEAKDTVWAHTLEVLGQQQ
jgi:NAD(P)-dependent dehydrogenase (short-subunit alcohol dehydrogenase family)